MVVGCFDDEDIIHVEGDVDPARDLEIIHDELRLKDLEFVRKQLEPLEKSITRGGDKGRKFEYVSISKVETRALRVVLLTTSNRLTTICHLSIL